MALTIRRSSPRKHFFGSSRQRKVPVDLAKLSIAISTDSPGVSSNLLQRLKFFKTCKMSFHHFAKPSLSLRNKPFRWDFSLGLDPFLDPSGSFSICSGPFALSLSRCLGSLGSRENFFDGERKPMKTNMVTKCGRQLVELAELVVLAELLDRCAEHFEVLGRRLRFLLVA